jgi:hypothetical protein
MRASFPGHSRFAACGYECIGRNSRLTQIQSLTENFQYMQLSVAVLAGLR